MEKYLILFGAGASYGSDDPNFTPPLGGKALFNALFYFDPNGWGKLSKEQCKLFIDDFEVGMESISKNYPEIMPPLQRAMAKYFFEFKPRNANLYHELARKISLYNWNGSLATLNYERLLMFALETAGVKPFFDKRNENSNKEIEICIPHGTCNIFCTSVIANNTTQFRNCEIDGPVKLLSVPDAFKKEIETNAVPPVMSYFIPSKETMSGLTFIKNQRKRLEELIKESSIIGIIGLKTRIHDEHIWRPLAETNASIVYCSGKTAGDEFKKWCDINRAGKKNEVLEGFFKESFDEFCEKLRLS